MDNYKYGLTKQILLENDLTTNHFCFEFSEKYKYEMSTYTKNFLLRIIEDGYSYAIDDFGAGFSGLEIFYLTNPRYIKFDRFLISNIDSDDKKRLFADHLLSLAKALNVQVIAEGVETADEFSVCYTLGFDYI